MNTKEIEETLTGARVIDVHFEPSSIYMTIEKNGRTYRFTVIADCEYDSDYEACTELLFTDLLEEEGGDGGGAEEPPTAIP